MDQATPFTRYEGTFSNHSLDASLRDFWTLMKPGVMSLVVFTGLIGAYLAPGQSHPLLMGVSILSIAMASASASVFNMWYDRDIDSVMSRTKKRPIPMGRVAPEDALGLSLFLGIISILMMCLSANVASACLLAFSIFFYTVIYTILLKRHTPQNIVIGGAAGAFPPLIGWMSVTGHADFFPVCMFLIIFLWTPFHFWALALYKSDDYKKVKVPMYPNVHGIDKTKKAIMVYALLLAMASLAPFFMGWLGGIYGVCALVLSGANIEGARRLFVSSDPKTSLKVFLFSIISLFLLFLSMALDHLLMPLLS